MQGPVDSTAEPARPSDAQERRRQPSVRPQPRDIYVGYRQSRPSMSWQGRREGYPPGGTCPPSRLRQSGHLQGQQRQSSVAASAPVAQERDFREARHCFHHLLPSGPVLQGLSVPRVPPATHHVTGCGDTASCASLQPSYGRGPLLLDRVTWRWQVRLSLKLLEPHPNPGFCSCPQVPSQAGRSTSQPGHVLQWGHWPSSLGLGVASTSLCPHDWRPALGFPAPLSHVPRVLPGHSSPGSNWSLLEVPEAEGAS